MKLKTLDDIVEVVIVNGVEGPSLYIKDYRVCGPKPWGGGHISHTFHTTPREILRALFDPVVGVGVTDDDVVGWHTNYRKLEAEVIKESLSRLESLPWPEGRTS